MFQSHGYEYNPTTCYYIFIDSGSTKPPSHLKSTTTIHETTSTLFQTSSDPSSFRMTSPKLSSHSQRHHHSNQKRSNTKSYPIDQDYTLSDPIYTLSSNWTFPRESTLSKLTLTEEHISKILAEPANENRFMLDDDSILKQLVEETKAPVVFLSANNTAINAHSGTSVTLPCIIKKESKFEMVSW